MTTLFEPQREGWTLYRDEGFIGLVGPFWTLTTGSETRYGFIAEPRHANLLSVVQGGMLMTFADRALGVAAWAAAGGRPCATVQFNAQFVASAQVGSFLELSPLVLKRTRSLVFMSGSIMQGDELVLHAQGVWKVLNAPTPAPAG